MNKNKFLIFLLICSIVLNIVSITLLFKKDTNEEAEMLYEESVLLLQKVSNNLEDFSSSEDSSYNTIMLHYSVEWLYQAKVMLMEIQPHLEARGVSVQRLIYSIGPIAFNMSGYVRQGIKGVNISNQEIQALHDYINEVLSQIPEEYDIEELKKSMNSFNYNIRLMP